MGLSGAEEILTGKSKKWHITSYVMWLDLQISLNI